MYYLEIVINGQTMGRTLCADIAQVAQVRQSQRPIVLAARRHGATARLNVQHVR